jgi:hypothetical protein
MAGVVIESAVIAQDQKVNTIAVWLTASHANQGGGAASELQGERDLPAGDGADGINFVQGLAQPVPDLGGHQRQARNNGDFLGRLPKVSDKDRLAEPVACQGLPDGQVQLGQVRHGQD